MVSLPADITVTFTTRWSSSLLEDDDCVLDDARSLPCAESEVSNTASSLDAESLVVSSSRALNEGFSSLRGLDGGVSSLRGLDGGVSSLRGLDGGVFSFRGLDGGGVSLLSA